MKIKIDKQILPLIVAMNSTGWIETFSSCQGHPKAKGQERKCFPKPYIAFYCESSKVNELCKILNQIETVATDTKRDRYICFDLGIIHSNEVCGCQGDAKKGWLALNLNIETKSAANKRRTFIQLAKLFEQQTAVLQ